MSAYSHDFHFHFSKGATALNRASGKILICDSISENGSYSGNPFIVSICMLRGSTHYCAIAPRALSRHIVDFLGSHRMETAATSIKVHLIYVVHWAPRHDIAASMS